MTTAYLERLRVRLAATMRERPLEGTPATALEFHPAGPPQGCLALWHGGGNDRLWGFWLLIEAALARGFAVVTAHQPGHGPGSDVFGLKEAQSRLDALVAHAERLGPPVTLLGQSMGAAFVLDRLARGLGPAAFIAVSPPLSLPLGPRVLTELPGLLVGREARCARRYVSAGEALPSFGPFRRDRFPLRTHVDYLTEFRLVLAALDLEARLPRARSPHPVLLIHGTHDGIVPVSHGERLAAALGPQAVWRPIRGARHFNPLLRDDVVDALLAWAALPHAQALPLASG